MFVGELCQGWVGLWGGGSLKELELNPGTSHCKLTAASPGRPSQDRPNHTHPVTTRRQPSAACQSGSFTTFSQLLQLSPPASCSHWSSRLSYLTCYHVALHTVSQAQLPTKLFAWMELKCIWGILAFIDHETDSSSCKPGMLIGGVRHSHAHTQKSTHPHTCTPSEIHPRPFRASISHST